MSWSTDAGYQPVQGMIEELSEAEVAESRLRRNLFGALWVTQAALPLLHGAGLGSSSCRISFNRWDLGLSERRRLPQAQKWALEGFSQALAAEVSGFGIHVTAYRTGRVLHRLGWCFGEARQAIARL